MKKISEVKSYMFDNNIIIAFSINWLNVFQQMPEFEVFVNKNNKLQLVSKQEIRLAGADLCE